MIPLILAGMMGMMGQGLPFPGPGTVHATGGGGGGVAIVSSSVAIVTCSNGSTSCTYTKTISNSGDAELVLVVGCYASSCNAGPAGTLAVTDNCGGGGGNTYTNIKSANLAAWERDAFLAKNTIAGTNCTFTVQTSSADTMYHQSVFFVEMSGASLTAPNDSAVAAVQSGTSATPSITSAGNVTNTGEIVFGYMEADNSLTQTGSFANLLTAGANNVLSQLTHPASGATVTDSYTQTSGAFNALIVAVTP